MPLKVSLLTGTILLLLVFSLVAPAQTVTGSIVGSVIDPSGLAISGAEVSAVLIATGATRTTHSNERGDFVLGSLQPGEYNVSFSSKGFKTLHRVRSRFPRSRSCHSARLRLRSALSLRP
jgi:hypothetical protein